MRSEMAGKAEISEWFLWDWGSSLRLFAMKNGRRRSLSSRQRHPIGAIRQCAEKSLDGPQAPLGSELCLKSIVNAAQLPTAPFLTSFQNEGTWKKE